MQRHIPNKSPVWKAVHLGVNLAIWRRTVVSRETVPKRQARGCSLAVAWVQWQSENEPVTHVQQPGYKVFATFHGKADYTSEYQVVKWHTHIGEKDHLCAETFTVQASSQRQKVEKFRGMEIMFFSDALAGTPRNTSAANAWAHYEVSKGKNKERWTLCVWTDLRAALVPGLLLWYRAAHHLAAESSPSHCLGKESQEWNGKYEMLNKLWMVAWENRDKGLDFPCGAPYLGRIVLQSGIADMLLFVV